MRSHSLGVCTVLLLSMTALHCVAPARPTPATPAPSSPTALSAPAAAPAVAAPAAAAPAAPVVVELPALQRGGGATESATADVPPNAAFVVGWIVWTNAVGRGPEMRVAVHSQRADEGLETFVSLDNVRRRGISTRLEEASWRLPHGLFEEGAHVEVEAIHFMDPRFELRFTRPGVAQPTVLELRYEAATSWGPRGRFRLRVRRPGEAPRDVDE